MLIRMKQFELILAHSTDSDKSYSSISTQTVNINHQFGKFSHKLETETLH